MSPWIVSTPSKLLAKLDERRGRCRAWCGRKRSLAPASRASSSCNEQIEFPLVIDREIELLDRVDRHRSCGEKFRTSGSRMYVRARRSTRRRDRGAQEQRLPLAGTAAENFFDVGAEADVEHAIGFVEHDDANRSQVEGAAADEVEHAAGRADDDVGAVLQFADLAADRFAAVDGDAVDAAAVGQLFEFLADLHGQFARRHQDEGLRRRAFAAAFELFEDRNGEGGRLAGAGAGLAEHVDACERVRDDAGLDGRWLLVLGLLERRQHDVGKVRVSRSSPPGRRSPASCCGEGLAGDKVMRTGISPAIGQWGKMGSCPIGSRPHQ